MKTRLTFFVLTFYCFCRAQSFDVLQEQEKWDTIPRGKSVIYGTFVHGLSRLKATSLPQFVHVLNTTTNRLYTMQVKPRENDAAENKFICVVPPGKYTIVDYRYSANTDLGLTITTYTTGIFAAPDRMEADTSSGVDTSQVGGPDRITFEVRPRTLCYVGVWDFKTTDITFRNNKTNLDPEFRKFKKLDFARAETALPSPAQGTAVHTLRTAYVNDPTNEEVRLNRLIERRHNRVAPLYGRAKRSAARLNAEQAFADTTVERCKCSRSEASRTWSEKAWKLYEAGNNEAASRYFNLSWLLDSTNFSTYWGFGSIMKKQRRYSEALPLLQAAYDHNPHKKGRVFAELCTDYATALSGDFAEQKHEFVYSQALEFFAEAEKNHPNSGRIYKERSVLFYRAGKLPEALADYEKSVTLDPNLADRRYYRDLTGN